MTNNIHIYERLVRVLVGLGMVILAITDPINLWLLIGLVPLITGLIGWCPPYSLLGINTCYFPNNKPGEEE